MSGGWVVSGIGLVTASGDTPADLHLSLCDGVPLRTAREGSGPVAPGAGAGLAVCPIDGFDPKRYLQARGLKDLSRTSQLACAAAAPLAAALGGVPPQAAGVALGSGWGSLRSIVDFEWETCTEQVRFVNPLLFAETVANVPAGQISIHFGWSAFNLTVSSGSASGLQAIEEGIERLAEGRASLVLAGGADELNLPALRVLRAGAAAAAGPGSLPFGRGRSGPVGGEGACLLLIETTGSARERGAAPLARVLATASRFVPPDGATGAPPAPQIAAFLRGLVDRAGIATSEVDLMVASACGSQAIDREEAGAIGAVFGAGPDGPMVVAPKAILGETWGASGPLAAAVAIETMRAGVVPGRPRPFEADPDLPALNMPAEPVARAVRHAVVLAVTAAGHVAGLVLARGGAAVPTEAWRDLLPWRYPFLTIDALVECVPHKRITTMRRVSGDDLLVRAHGPGGAILPGVMVLEGLNQSAALLYRLTYGDAAGARLPLLGHLRAGFPGTAAPGDTITYKVKAVKMTPTHGLFEGRAMVDGRTIVEGELGFAMAAAAPGGAGG